MAVNGEPLKSGENYWRLFTLAPGRRFELTVSSKPSLEGAWTTRVDAVNGKAYGTLRYEKWSRIGGRWWTSSPVGRSAISTSAR